MKPTKVLRKSSVSDFYKFLNIPFAVDTDYLFKIWNIESNNRKSLRRFENKQDILKIFTDDIWKILNKLKCDVIVSEAFYTPPFGRIGWHTDVNGFNQIFNYVKINFVWSESSNHEMQWGVNKNTNFRADIGYNKAGSAHLSYEDTDMVIIDRVKIDNTILVNVGQPHRVINNSSKGRYCVCLIPKKNDHRISFEEAVELFNDYILN